MFLYSVFLLLLSLSFTMISAGAASIFDYSVPAVAGGDVEMSNFKGQKAYLLVNVASYWGLTNQNYAELQELYLKYSAVGLEIIAFPCNDFGAQEPKPIEEVVQFAQNKGATFSVMGKISMSHPMYQMLQGAGQAITWNFGKFLCDASGTPVAQYQPNQAPLSFEADIAKLLATPGSEL